MAKKIYVCDNLTAKDVKYAYSESCGIEADNVQDALDIMCTKINTEVKDKHYVETFWEPNDTWEVLHNLNKMVAVTIEDLDGNDMEGDVEYVDLNIIVIHFSQPVSGSVFVN